jgi:hypothetical protein
MSCGGRTLLNFLETLQLNQKGYEYLHTVYDIQDRMRVHRRDGFSELIK